jgi:hypothetical protein
VISATTGKLLSEAGIIVTVAKIIANPRFSYRDARRKVDLRKEAIALPNRRIFARLRRSDEQGSLRTASDHGGFK